MTPETGTMANEPTPPDHSEGDTIVSDVPEPEPDRGSHFPPPAPPPRSRWWDTPIARDRDERRIGGVVAGVSRAFGFDLRVARIVTVIAAFVLPGVVPLYIALMILLPKRTEDAKPLSPMIAEHKRRTIVAVVIVLVVFSGWRSWSFFGGFGWGAALIGVGIVLWLSPNFATNLGPRVASDPSLASGADSLGANDLPTARHAVGPPTAVRRRRHPVQEFALAGASLTALVMGMGNAAGWWRMTTFGIAVAVLAILIGGTFIGTIVNRSWLGMPMLLVFGTIFSGLLVTHPNLDGGFGDRTVRPTDIAEAQQPLRLGGGSLTIDLTTLPAGREPVHIDAQVGYGRLRVLVAAGDDVRVATNINAGHVVIDGVEITAGVRHQDARMLVSAEATEPAGRPVVLDLRLGAGEITVERVG